MKNETIKTYTPITVEEAGEMLRDNGWSKPVEGLAFRSSAEYQWHEAESLSGLDMENGGEPFFTKHDCYGYCAKVTELDPCKAPDGCPELEPWMAYVGELADQTRTGMPLPYPFHANEPFSDDWDTMCRGGCNDAWPCCIDVRTEWAQEHFPEHCRIRNYKEPDAFEEWFSHDKFMGCKTSFRAAYELGQKNPTTK